MTEPPDTRVDVTNAEFAELFRSVTIGPDGAYYLAQRTGVPFAAGAANVYRVVLGQAPAVLYTGFTTIINLTFGPDGSLYVLEHSTGPVSSRFRDGC